MHFISGIPRKQIVLFNEYLDDIISEDNSVRLIDAYIEKLDMVKLKFKIPELKTGKPPYSPQVLLKIYIYGYMEKIRSSRNLEKECNRNRELIWLTEYLAPDFKTIADFRKDNREGIKNVFKEFLFFCRNAGLLSLSKVGIDGTKLRAQNSLNNVFKSDTIDNIGKKIEEKIAEYITELEINDKNESEDLKLKNGKETQEVIDKLKKLSKYQAKVKDVKELFASDPELKMYFANDNDSRFQSDKGKIRPGYNAQIAVDDKNKLIITADVTNQSNDLAQMTPMIEQVEEIKKDLEIDTKTDAVMDAGYFNEKEILKNKDKEKIKIIVSDTKEAKRKNEKRFNTPQTDKIPAIGYEAKDFIYDKERDICICPEGKELYKTHSNPAKEKSGREVFEFQCKDCATCGKYNKCTKNKRGRSIKISAKKEVMDNFKKEMQTIKMKRIISSRKEIVEHPFGTIKRNAGYTYFMQKGLEKVKSEFSFICFVYNFKRVLKILSLNEFIIALNRL